MNQDTTPRTRRLPVYLVLDCSGSMAGEPIEAVRMGLSALLADLQQNPEALETVWLSVITFESSARQVVPLTEVVAFREPTLRAGGASALGEALDLLNRCIDREVRRTTAHQKGDWKPLVFLMTDGVPTDSWEHAADDLRRKKLGNIIACAAGPGADGQMLKRITEVVVQLKDTTPGMFSALVCPLRPAHEFTTPVTRKAGDTCRSVDLILESLTPP